MGGDSVTNEVVAGVLRSPEWSKMPSATRLAFAEAFKDSDVEEHEVRSALAAWLRGRARMAARRKISVK